MNTVVPSASHRSRRLLRPSRRMRIGAIQSVCVVGGVALGLLIPRIQQVSEVDSTLAIQAILAMGLGVVGLITVVFSLLFTVVQWVYGTFSQRLQLFEEHWITWWVFGMSIGVFSYSLVASYNISSEPRAGALVPAVAFAGVLVTLVLMRQMQLIAFTSVQLSPTLQRLATRGHAVLADLYPDPFDGSRADPGGPPEFTHRLRWSGKPGVLQQVDVARILELGRECDSDIELTAVGEALLPDREFARASSSRVVASSVARTLERGPHRTFDQDPLLAVRLVADIALKALSPAVNDPATAVQAMDVLEVLLLKVVDRDLQVGRFGDESSGRRLWLKMPDWEDFAREGLADLVVCSAPLPTAASRLELLLERLIAAAPQSRQALLGSLRATLVSGTGA